MAETVRTFVAIELSDEPREFLAARQRDLKGAGGKVRWVRPERMHLTLVFLGNVPADRLDELEAAVREACVGTGPIRLQIGGAGQFPTRGRPRVVWTGVEEPTGALLELQKHLAEATASFAEKPEKRAYHAHLTLGRIRSGNPRPLSEAVASLAEEAGPAFTAEEVVVFRSDLSPHGPTYTALARAALTGKGGRAKW
jgi:2'-5' RNA ligase